MINKQQREENRQEYITDWLNVWHVLIEQAQCKETIQYRHLRQRARGQPGNFAQFVKVLNGIYSYCLCKKLPPLPVLAVSNRRNNNEPEAGYLGVDIEEDTRRVINFDWLDVPTPKPEDFI